MAVRPTPPTGPGADPAGRRRHVGHVVVGLIGVGLVSFALATAGTQAAADGGTWDPPRAVSWETALLAGAGALLLVLLVVAGVWALLQLTRGHAWVLGVVAVAVLLAEAAVNIALQLWRPWLPIMSVEALLTPGGKTFELYRNRGMVGWDGPVFVHVGQLRAAAVLTLLTLVVVGAALSTARSRRAPRRRALPPERR